MSIIFYKIAQKCCIYLFFIVRYLSMSQDHLIKLANKETGEIYYTRKNRKKVERKLEYKKYSKVLRKHITFKEAKK